MKNLKKMTAEECSVPVGAECPCPSQLEAELFFAKTTGCKNYIRLMQLTSEENKNYLCWCSFDKNWKLRFSDPLFEDGCIPKTLPKRGRPLQEGEYLRYKDDVYVICIDDMLGTVIRQIHIRSTAQDACVAWRVKKRMPPTDNSDDEPDCYLVKIFRVSKPNECVCVCWYIVPPLGKTIIMPVFLEDQEKFSKIPFNSLNWSFFKEEDVFQREDTMYQVCRDEMGCYYIAPTPLQICH